MGFTKADLEAMQARLRGKARQPAAAPQGVSTATVARNPHLYGTTAAVAATGAVAGKRVKQDKAPKENKTELAWGAVLDATYPDAPIWSQSIRFRLASGAWYRPDRFGLVNGQLTGWEVKGGKNMKGVPKGTLALKCAASTYPQIKWFLIWKEAGTGRWMEQLILP